MNTEDFANKIKAKYPQYADMDNTELVNKIIAKYPVYKQSIINEQTSSSVQPLKGVQAPGILRGVTAPALRLGQFAGKEIAGLIGGEEAKQRAEQAIQQPTTIPGLGKGTTFPGLKPEGEGRGKQLAGEALESGAYFAPYGRIAGALTKAGLGKTIANILTGALGGYTADVALDMQEDKTLGQTLTPGLGTVVGGAIPAVPALLRAGRAIVAPKKTLEKALGEVIQGKTNITDKAVNAFKEVDTKGVKTYQELSNKFNESIKNLSRIVDDELAKDTTKYTLDDFLITQSTKSGQEVNTNYVVRALQDLGELYQSTGDDVSFAEINDFVSRIQNAGITKKEVNDLARLYGQEFGSKAFNKIGDPLTSVNAQRFENTREGLKLTARNSIGGEEARLADQKISSLYSVKDLVDNTVEKVNSLKNRINERGLLEQLGRGAVKFIDTITGGTVRGAVGGLLPRGVGNKVMNALDLEEALRKNLDIIEKALGQTDDGAFIKAINKLKFPGDIIDEQTNAVNKIKEFIDNPKIGLSVEDVSKKAGNVSDELASSIQKAKASGKTFDEWVKGQGVVDDSYKSLKWDKIPDEGVEATVPLSKIKVSSDALKKATEAVKRGDGSRTSGVIEVALLKNGDLAIVDGHHRAVQKVLQGDGNIKARVYSTKNAVGEDSAYNKVDTTFSKDDGSKTRSQLKAEWDKVKSSLKRK